jgi:hypothetical protein
MADGHADEAGNGIGELLGQFGSSSLLVIRRAAGAGGIGVGGREGDRVVKA